MTLDFIVRYRPSGQSSLRPHSDASTFSVNVALNSRGTDYQGGGTRFIRQNCESECERSGLGLRPAASVCRQVRLPLHPPLLLFVFILLLFCYLLPRHVSGNQGHGDRPPGDADSPARGSGNHRRLEVHRCVLRGPAKVGIGCLRGWEFFAIL